MNTNPVTIIRDLRLLMPARSLEAHEAQSVAERQAIRLRELFGTTDDAVDVGLIAKLPRIHVRVDSRLANLGISGYSESSRGRWDITINRTDAVTRRRYTLAHELKHVLDHPFVRVLYPGQSEENKQAERVCDYFAACLLMPRMQVKRLWGQRVQNIDELAARFRVSPAAMARRLQDLGLLERPTRHKAFENVTDVTRYFRRDSAQYYLMAA